MKRIIILFLVLLFCRSTDVFAAFGYDPWLNWQTLQTDNFSIHYHDGSEELAKRVAQVAERTHLRLTKYFQWVPVQRTEVIVNDRVDFSNGAATPIFYNTMFLFVTPPDDVNTLEDYDDWLDLLIVHEYTHILHLDKATRAAGVFRKIFGRAIAFPVLFATFPNAFQPSFYVEGLATYMETDKDKGVGRGQSSAYEMLMRMETMDGIKTLRNVNQPMAKWPAGTTRYLYGVYFWQYVADTYGADKIPEWVDSYSGRMVPWFLNSTSIRTLGDDLDDVWSGFEQHLKKKFDPQIAAVREKGVREGKQLTHEGYYTDHPAIMPNGDIYYVRNNFKNETALMWLPAGGKKAKPITKVHGNRFDTHKDAGLLLTQLNIVSNTEIFSDIYQVTRKHKVIRLTHGGRYRSATWSPDGKKIIAVHNQAGNNGLHLLDAKGNILEILWQGKNSEVVGELDWSPDGTQVVAPVWRPDNRWDLELFNIASKSWKQLSKTDDIEMHPRFIGNNKIVFSADYGGIYNIHQMDLESRQTDSLTNVVGGAFHPSLSQDGNSLVYTGFTRNGYEVFRLDQDSTTTSSLQHASAPKKTYDNEPWQAQAMPVYSITPYSPWHTMTPRWWFPTAILGEYQTVLGVQTASSDALGRHSYFVAPAYDVENNWHEGAFAYMYDRWNPAFRLLADRSASVELNRDDELDRIRSDVSASAELIFPLLDLDYQWGLHTALIYNREKDARLGDTAVSQPEQEDTLSGAAITFNSAQRFPLSVSLNRGRVLKMVAENSDYLDGDYSGKIFTGEWQEYFSWGGQHVFAVRLVGGHGTENPRPFELGGNLPEEMGHPLGQGPGQLFNRREYSLRGYPDGLFELRGRKMALGTMEYRFPIVRIERGVTAPVPIGVHQMYAKAFMEAGEAWNNEADREPLRTSAGFEYHVEFVVGYAFLLNLRLGAAYGFDKGGEGQLYGSIGASF